MNLKYQNVIWKIFQSFLGFVLIAIQSQFISGIELATLAIAQGMLVVVSLFDFGLGVRLTTWTVVVIQTSTLPNTSQKVIAQRLLYSRRAEIYLVALAQSLVFGLSYLLLNYKLSSKLDLVIGSIFSLTVFFQSIGNNFGRVNVATGQINLLVKLQSAGALIGFCGGLVGLKTNLSLEISVFALCLSSLFIGLLSMWPEKGASKDGGTQVAFVLDQAKKATDFKWNLNLQISQFFQFLQPLAVQYFVIESFESTGVVAYLICQRLFGAIGNALSFDTQLNYSLRQDANQLSMEDVFRFKKHLFGYVLVSTAIVLFLVNFWRFSFPDIPPIGFLDLMSFIPLGLCVFVDQAIKIRLYVLSLYFREMFSNFILIFSLTLIAFVYSAQFTSVLNFLIVCSYLLKFIAILKPWINYGR